MTSFTSAWMAAARSWRQFCMAIFCAVLRSVLTPFCTAR